MSVRVLQAMAGARHGGAEAFFTRLAVALKQAGLEQRVLIRRDPARRQALRQGGVEPVELGFGGPLDLLSRWRFRREIERFRPDLVLTWMNRASRLCPQGRFVRAARLGGYYKLKYYRGSDHLIGNTRDIRDWVVRQGWPAERAHYLPNFVAERSAPPVPREALGTPADAPLLLALGRLHGNKAFEVLLAALAGLPEAWLWLMGEGPLETMLRREAARLDVAGRVRFLGWQQDPAPYFAAADLVVVPSRHEPLGNVVIEAWAQRRPVVAAASSGPAALIRDGVSGLLCPVDDADALARAIGRALAAPDLRAALVAGGRAAYEAEFTEARVVAGYLRFFHEVAG